VLAAEHQLYPAALSWLAAGRVRLEAGRANIASVESAPDSLLNPLPRAVLLSTT
jgi:phosphoribosylglycinamide formyltransferase-1